MNLQKEELGEGDTGSVANLNDLLHAATGNISHDRTESPGKGANFKSREELESTLIISSEYKSASTEPKQASSTKKRKLSSESRAAIVVYFVLIYFHLLIYLFTLFTIVYQYSKVYSLEFTTLVNVFTFTCICVNSLLSFTSPF